MRIPRFYCPEIEDLGELFQLPDQVHRHAIQVLRLKQGAELMLFDGQGSDYRAELVDIGRRESTVKIISTRVTDVESPIQTVLLQGISRGERMDYTIQKAVELGVNRIIPVITERCNTNLTGTRGEKKLAHWLGVITSACEQSGRGIIPQLDPISELEPLLLNDFQGHRIVLDPNASSHFNSLQKTETVNLLIGPEGGLSEQEVEWAKQAGFITTQFGPRVLRTETAAVAALAVIQALWGDLGG